MSDDRTGGVLSPVRNLARTLLSFIETRTRLAANEVEEQALRLVEVVLWRIAALACAVIGLATLSVLVVLLTRDGGRLMAAGLVALAWLIAAAAFALVARARQRERPRLLSGTLAELDRDRSRFEKPDA